MSFVSATAPTPTPHQKSHLFLREMLLLVYTLGYDRGWISQRCALPRCRWAHVYVCFSSRHPISKAGTQAQSIRCLGAGDSTRTNRVQPGMRPDPAPLFTPRHSPAFTLGLGGPYGQVK